MICTCKYAHSSYINTCSFYGCSLVGGDVYLYNRSYSFYIILFCFHFIVRFGGINYWSGVFVCEIEKVLEMRARERESEQSNRITEVSCVNNVGMFHPIKWTHVITSYKLDITHIIYILFPVFLSIGIDLWLKIVVFFLLRGLCAWFQLVFPWKLLCFWNEFVLLFNNDDDRSITKKWKFKNSSDFTQRLLLCLLSR